MTSVSNLIINSNQWPTNHLTNMIEKTIQDNTKALEALTAAILAGGNIGGFPTADDTEEEAEEAPKPAKKKVAAKKTVRRKKPAETEETEEEEAPAPKKVAKKKKAKAPKDEEDDLPPDADSIRNAIREARAALRDKGESITPHREAFASLLVDEGYDKIGSIPAEEIPDFLELVNAL